MTPYFSSTFSVLTVCNIYFYIQNGQNSFLYGPGFILVREIPQFGQKLPIWTAHHTFLESRHTTVTQNPYYVLSLSGAKKLSAHGLIPVCRGAYIPCLKTTSSICINP